jgi:hypothetical protein
MSTQNSQGILHITKPDHSSISLTVVLHLYIVVLSVVFCLLVTTESNVALVHRMKSYRQTGNIVPLIVKPLHYIGLTVSAVFSYMCTRKIMGGLPSGDWHFPWAGL